MLFRFAAPPVYDMRYQHAVRLFTAGSFHSRLGLSTGFTSCAPGRQAHRRSLAGDGTWTSRGRAAAGARKGRVGKAPYQGLRNVTRSTVE
jgi:hypothetical protein